MQRVSELDTAASVPLPASPSSEAEDALLFYGSTIPSVLSVDPAVAQIDVTLAALQLAYQSEPESRSDIVTQYAQLRYERNRLYSPIHRLPSELFIDILTRTFTPSSWQLHRIHGLAQVAKYWAFTILSCPLLWPRIDIQDDAKLRKLILRRNPAGPLHVRCKIRSSHNAKFVEDFWKLVALHSSRWRGVAFRGALTDSMVRYLEQPMPNLRDLFIFQTSEGPSQPVIRLADGPPLRDLDLEYASVPWDSGRLSRLKSIQLRNLTGALPSLRQLHTVLSASPELWLLLLSNIQDGIFTGALTPRDRDDCIGTLGPIHLPNLSMLLLQNVVARISDFLLSSIAASSCKCVIADSLNARLLQGDTQSAVSSILSSAIGGVDAIRLEYSDKHNTLNLLSDPPVNMARDAWVYQVRETAGIRVTITADLYDQWHDVAVSLAFSDARPSISLALDDGNEYDEADGAPRFPIGSIRHLTSITKVSCGDSCYVSPLLRYLSSPQPTPQGGTSWPLPHLSELVLKSEKVESKAVISWFKDRYLDDKGEVRAEVEMLTFLGVPKSVGMDLEALSVVKSLGIVKSL